jgi:hypothetical protein
MLLEAGANATLRAADGKTAFDYAELNIAVKGTDVYWKLKKATF